MPKRPPARILILLPRRIPCERDIKISAVIGDGFAASDNPLAAKVIDKDSGFISQPFSYENGFSIVRVNAKEMPHPKEFKDAIPDAASQYQEYLSKKVMSDWIDSLRQRYPVKIYDDVLKHIVAANK